MVAILGQPEGVFNLNNSDKFVGSYLTKSDIKEILNVSDSDLANVSFKTVDANAGIKEMLATI